MAITIKINKYFTFIISQSSFCVRVCALAFRSAVDAVHAAIFTSLLSFQLTVVCVCVHLTFSFSNTTADSSSSTDPFHSDASWLCSIWNSLDKSVCRIKCDQCVCMYVCVFFVLFTTLWSVLYDFYLHKMQMCRASHFFCVNLSSTLFQNVHKFEFTHIRELALCWCVFLISQGLGNSVAILKILKNMSFQFRNLIKSPKAINQVNLPRMRPDSSLLA